MSEVTRRGALAIAGGALAIPLVPAARAVAVAAPALPAWQVGIAGRMNWRIVYAATAERARHVWATGYFNEGYGEEDIAALAALAEPIATPGIEPAAVEDERPPTPEEMLDLGWDYNCDRCYRDCSADFNGGVVIDGAIVCDDCTTPAENPDFWKDRLDESNRRLSGHR